MNILFIGLILNIIAGIFCIPIGPERYIKRLYTTANSLFSDNLDSQVRRIADIIVFLLVMLYILLLVWFVSGLYQFIPIPFTEEIIAGILFCLTIRLGQSDSLYLIHLIKSNKRNKAVSVMQKRNMIKDDFISDSELCSSMIYKWTKAVRLIVCPLFYISFGIIPAFLYKVIEIISRTQKNFIANILYRILSFIPQYIFFVILRLSALLLKRKIISGNNLHKLANSFLGIDIDKDIITFNDIIRLNILMYISIAIFILIICIICILIG